MVAIRPVKPTDRVEWLRMRTLLWPDCPRPEHVDEIDDYFSDVEDDQVDIATFVAENHEGALVGFIELSLRSTAEGCRTQPVGYIEGWYVDAKARREGIGRSLVKAGENWAIGHGCVEMASDTELDNHTSQLAHEQLGYEEVERVVLFRKILPSR